VNRLELVDTQEVSLVRRGANRKEFIKKTGDETMTPEMIAKLLGMSKLDKTKLDAALKEMHLSPEVHAAIEGAVRMLDAVKDQLPPDVLAHVSALANVAMPKSDDDANKVKPFPFILRDGLNDKKPDDLMKSLDKLPADVRAALQKQHDEQAAKIAKMEGDLAAQRADLSARSEAELDRVSLAKAESMLGLPGEKSVVAAVIKQATKFDPNLGKSIEQILAAANAVIVTSKAFSETGSGAGGGAGATTMERVNKMADELVGKAGKLMSHAQAVTKVFADNPTLYSDYLAGK